MAEDSPKSISAEEIQNRVKELEDLFVDRYTERDVDFMKTVNKEVPDPPCVENWFVRRGGNWNRGGYQGGGDRRHDNYHGNQRQYGGHYSNRGGGHQQRYDNYGRHGNQGYDNYNRHGNQGRQDRRYQPY